jgi:hypothetical protein
LVPSVWAFDTLGYATNGTFPAGGPASTSTQGGGLRGGFGAGARGPGAGGLGGAPLFGPGGVGSARSGGPPAGAGPVGPPPGFSGGAGGSSFLGGPSGPGARGGFAGPGGAGGPFGNDRSLTKVLSYVKEHGGGTIAVSSQSSASRAIIEQNADVAGIGGFSGRESDVSLSWLAQEVRTGKIRWVLAEQGGGGRGPGLPGDTRAGSRAAMARVAKVCRAVTLPAAGAGKAGGGSSESGLYDCGGRAALLSAGARESRS